MKNIIYVLLLIGIIECAYIHKQIKPSVNAKRQKKECLKELEQDVKKYWYYDEKHNYYVANDTFILKLNKSYYTCIKGMDTSSFFKIFGRPNISTLNNLHPELNGFEYLFNPYNHVVYFIVLIDKKGKLLNKGSFGLQDRID